MSAAHRRELAREAVEGRQCSQRQACRFFGLNRSTYRYQAMYPSLHVLEVEREIVELSQEHPELGSDKIGRLVRKQGYRVSNDRVRRVRREEGLVVPPPKKKERRRGPSTGRFPQIPLKRARIDARGPLFFLRRCVVRIQGALGAGHGRGHGSAGKSEARRRVVKKRAAAHLQTMPHTHTHTPHSSGHIPAIC